MKLSEINISQVSLIKDLAHRIWPFAYAQIITMEQLDYMLDLIYSEESLVKQMQNGQQFFVLFDNHIPIGFLGIQYNCKEKRKMKVHKIYLLPELQGKGLGKWMLTKAEEMAKANHQESIFLNVNKFNKAKFFYENIGFDVVKEEVIDIGNGYVMDDYVMEKKIN